MNNKLFIGNISWDATEEDLKAVFEEIGPVEEVKLIIDKFKNRPKGFGFVTFTNEEDAKRAKEELDGREVMGRPIRLDAAKPPREDDNQAGGAY